MSRIDYSRLPTTVCKYYWSLCHLVSKAATTLWCIDWNDAKTAHRTVPLDDINVTRLSVNIRLFFHGLLDDAYSIAACSTDNQTES